MLQLKSNRKIKIGSIVLVMLFILGFSNSGLDAQERPIESVTQSKNGTDASVGEGETVAPKFDGNFSKYLSKTLRYPRKSRANKEEGRAVVQFIVNENGAIIQPEIKQSSGYSLLDQEALRVIRGMPAWIPGKQYGKNVQVFYTLPITFKINGK
ncbi:MAG: energy transducer TonB [Chitinophagaceae bacterium]